MKRAVFLALLLVAGTGAWGDAPQMSLRPVLRPVPEAEAAPAPKTETNTAEQEAPVKRGIFRSLRPKPRSEKAQANGKATQAARMRGMVCGDPALQGDVVGRVPGKINGCGVDNAVRLRSVSGVALSQPATIDCVTAKALKTWVDKALVPTVGKRGGGVGEMRIMASYACRTRNNQKGAKISEHGRGRAVDVGGFTLRDGTQVSVLKDWSKGKNGKLLKALHAKACGPFGTVLGPRSDRFHQDHFHFDTARYRSGSYCR